MFAGYIVRFLQDQNLYLSIMKEVSHEVDRYLYDSWYHRLKIAKDGWTPDQITCTITKPPLPADVAHPASVVVNKVPGTLEDTFTLRLPALDELSVISGAYPDPIKVTGKFFGTKKGKTYLYDSVNDKKNLKITDWKMNPSSGVSEITFVVPKPSKAFPAGSYQLKVTNKIGPASTSPDFTVLEPGP